MESNGVYVLVAVPFAAFAVSILAPQAAAWVSLRSLAARSQARAIKRGGLLSTVVRNGVPWAKPLARILLKAAKIRAFCEGAVRIMVSRGYATTAESLCSAWVACLCISALVGGLVGASPLFGAAVAACVAAASFMAVSHVREKRRDGLCEAIPDALRSMSVCSHAGLSLHQTFCQVAEEIDEPLKSLFVQASRNLEIGGTAEETLALFRKQSDVAELSFVAVALDIQHRSGGSLQQVLDSARDSVESGLELKRTLKVQTAQAKLSARIVSAMPFVLVALFSFVSPGFLSPFFQSAMGVCLLAVAAGMQIAGVFIVRRLLDVEIS